VRGRVLMVGAIPRGLFLLIGWAILDRLPAHSVAAIGAKVLEYYSKLKTLHLFTLNSQLIT
jgi:hypothetical protein